MVDFALARRHMVEGQIRTNDVTGPGIVEAMLDIPREQFVPPTWQALAYIDQSVPLHVEPARFLLEPMVFGKLLQIAAVQPSDRVLHIGCGSGYGSAVLARLAGEVIAIDCDEQLVERTKRALADLGASNTTVLCGSLESGWAEKAPYDLVFIEGAIERLPETLAEQIGPDGRLVAIVGNGRSGQGMLFRRTQGGLSGFSMFGASAPELPGFSIPKSFEF